MFNPISLLQRALCALALVLAGGAVHAGPIYHVTVDTAGLSGSGFLDFAVVGTPGAPSAVASVSQLSGDFGAERERSGQVAGAIPAGFSLSSGAGDNYLTQAVNFGGLFAFDISFGGDYESIDGLDGATFAIGLFDALFSQYTLAATFAAQPGSMLGAASLTPEAFGATTISAVSEVPEPSDLALVLAALGAAGLVLRARQKLASKPRPRHGSQPPFAAV